MNVYKKCVRDVIASFRMKALKKTAVNFEKENKPAFTKLKKEFISRRYKRTLIYSAVTLIMSLAGVPLFLFLPAGENAAAPVFGLAGCTVTALFSLIVLYMSCRLLKKKFFFERRKKVLFHIYWITLLIGCFAVLFQLRNIIDPEPVAAAMLFIMLPASEFTRNEAVVYAAGVTAGGCLVRFSAEFLAAMILSSLAFVYMSGYLYSSKLAARIQNIIMNDQKLRCEKLTTRDFLTETFNKNGLKNNIEKTFEISVYENLALIILDIDDFKQYRLMYGESKSDELITQISSAVKIISKEYTSDISRYFGDEFAIFTEGLSEVDTIKLAEQLRASIEQMALPFGKKIVTVTAAVSDIVQKDSDVDSVFATARLSLIAAKRAGKNCVGYQKHAFSSRF